MNAAPPIQKSDILLNQGRSGDRSWVICWRDGKFNATVSEVRDGQQYNVSADWRSFGAAVLFIKSMLAQSIIR